MEGVTLPASGSTRPICQGRCASPSGWDRPPDRQWNALFSSIRCSKRWNGVSFSSPSAKPRETARAPPTCSPSGGRASCAAWRPSASRSRASRVIRWRGTPPRPRCARVSRVVRGSPDPALRRPKVSLSPRAEGGLRSPSGQAGGPRRSSDRALREWYALPWKATGIGAPMRYPQLLIFEQDGRLARIFHDLAADRNWAAHARDRMWSLHEPRRPETCLRLLRRGGPSLLILKVGGNLEEELDLLERVTTLFPDTSTVVVTDVENTILAALAWDLGARAVLLPGEPRERLPELAGGFLGVSLTADPLPDAGVPSCVSYPSSTRPGAMAAATACGFVRPTAWPWKISYPGSHGRTIAFSARCVCGSARRRRWRSPRWKLGDKSETLAPSRSRFGSCRQCPCMGARAMNTLEQIARTLGFPVVVLPDIAAGSRESAIRFLVARLIEGGLVHVNSGEEIASSVLKRELLGSTALGGRVALPHGVSSAVDTVRGILARCSLPVPWDSPDGQPVETIFLTISPCDRPGSHLRVLEQISQAIKRKGTQED